VICALPINLNKIGTINVSGDIMKKIILVILIISMTAILAACNGTDNSIEAENAETANVDVDMSDESITVNVDTNDDEKPDVEARIGGSSDAEIIVDFEAVQDDETKETVAEAMGNEAYCVAGSTYEYDSNEGLIETIIIGKTMYKGNTYCQSETQSVITTPVGDITSSTTLYFDDTYKEYWVVTTTSGGPVPASTTEIHIIDGEIQ